MLCRTVHLYPCVCIELFCFRDPFFGLHFPDLASLELANLRVFLFSHVSQHRPVCANVTQWCIILCTGLIESDDAFDESGSGTSEQHAYRRGCPADVLRQNLTLCGRNSGLR